VSIAALPDDDVAPLVDLLAGKRFVALTGAGCSTESGIPDYRGGGRTGPRNPIQHDAFMRSADVRRRYWARATLGWSRFSGAEPNAAHRALAALEASGPLAGVITQNVDRLHQRAGSRRVVELHGALADVPACAARAARPGTRCTRGWSTRTRAGWRRLPRSIPTATPSSTPERVADFSVVGCRLCGGELKPDVVFFGGSVAERTLAAAWDLFAEAEVLLVVGSSLAVYSGFRFVRRAQERALPIAVVNVGPTRADELAAAKVSASVGEILPRLASALGVRS